MNEENLAMERLAFQLPDFVRISWISDTARDIWDPKIRKVMAAWDEIEWLSVSASVRPCAVKMISPEAFVAQAGAWAKRGLSAVPLAIHGVTSYSYSATPVDVELGKPFNFRIVLGTPENVADFQNAWEACDERGIGRLLGYPSCCQEFFEKTWVAQSSVDTTWAMGTGGVASANGVHRIDVTGPPESNILWRWMSVRAVPHLPCRFDCPSTVALAEKMLGVGREAGYGREMDWLLEILSWPVEWSAFHGIAEIKTPILRVSTRTDATTGKYVVRRKGDTYPTEGAKGVNFPYRPNDRPDRIPGAADSDELPNPLGATACNPKSHPAWYATDNGFDSVEVMERSQRPIVELASDALGQRGGKVLDLGCGNGALLSKILESNPDTIPFGIEAECARLEHARLFLPEFSDNFHCDDMFECAAIWADDRRYALGILMPGRLLEVDANCAERLRKRIREQCEQLLVYAYGDWLTRYGDLEELAQRAGVRLLPSELNGVASLAIIE